MNETKELSSVIRCIEKNARRLNATSKERLDELLSSFFEKDADDVYHCKTIKVESINGHQLELPIINLLPVSTMEMKKATFSVNGEQVKRWWGKDFFNKKKLGKDDIPLNGDGTVSFSIDFEAASPTETLLLFLDKNTNF
ncbi:TPA: hypothetical protein ACU9K7_003270 [Salmonella enterica]|nr:hypothetical protein [Salmonella enterica subsp. enterica serovar Miami]